MLVQAPNFSCKPWRRSCQWWSGDLQSKGLSNLAIIESSAAQWTSRTLPFGRYLLGGVWLQAEDKMGLAQWANTKLDKGKSAKKEVKERAIRWTPRTASCLEGWFPETAGFWGKCWEQIRTRQQSALFLLLEKSVAFGSESSSWWRSRTCLLSLCYVRSISILYQKEKDKSCCPRRNNLIMNLGSDPCHAFTPARRLLTLSSLSRRKKNKRTNGLTGF